MGLTPRFGSLCAEPSAGAGILLAENAPGDPVRGGEVFQKRCTGCHALNANREGPRLSGVYGRKAGSLPGFSYSIALSKSDITWTDATLEKWLRDPDLFVVDNNMSFSVQKEEERRDLIAFLRKQSEAR
jgi:cytochrome c